MSDNKPSMAQRASLIGHQIGGWALLAPGEAFRAASRMDRKSIAWATLALAAVLVLSVNLISSLAFRNARIDLTQDNLFTIDPGTTRILSKIDEPISVRVYYSRRLGEVAPVFGRYFDRVKALLEQYRDISRGKIQLTFVDPEPFSDAEDRAVASGLKGLRLNQDGETGYFGLVASNTTDNDAVVEFFSLERERFIEYDLTKLINGLTNPKKKVVGLMSGIPIEGGSNPMMPMRQPQQPWMIMEQLREFFEVRTVDQTAKSIPSDLDVLMVVQPIVLTKEAAYAVDQYALNGGRVLMFVDPVTETSPTGPPGMPLPLSKEVAGLLKAWGLALDESKVIGDKRLARRVQFGGGRGQQGMVAEYLAWLKLDKAQINEKDPLAAGVELLQLATAGALTKVEGATTIVQPIIQTTDRAGLIETDQVRMQPNPIAIAAGFKPGTTPLMLAARIGGEAKSAFPDGRPREEPKPEEGKDGAKPEADKAAAKPPEAKPDPNEKPHTAAGRVNIVVVADADMLHDQFWVDVRDFLGQQVMTPQSHNAAFVLNALENLSGGEALASLRGRGISERPFERVVAIRRTAEEQYRQSEEALVAKLKDLQGKLAQAETKGGDGGGPAAGLLTEKDKQTVEQFRTEMLKVRGQLREVKADLRRDIDRLDFRLKLLNIGAVPLVIGLGGIFIALRQRRRRANAA
jgi:ABC-type uncharacterized transport system involved in gliding motility auxiliary subunit